MTLYIPRDYLGDVLKNLKSQILDSIEFDLNDEIRGTSSQFTDSCVHLEI